MGVPLENPPVQDTAAPIQIFSEKPVMSVLGLIKLGAGLSLCGIVVMALIRGTGAGQNLLLMFGLAAMLALFGAYDLLKVADRRPQMQLTRDGFTALPLGPVLVPWSAVQSIEYIPGAGSAAQMRFHLRPEADMPMNFNPLALGGKFQLTANGARFVQVDTSVLANGEGLILAAVRRFAPDIPLINLD